MDGPPTHIVVNEEVPREWVASTAQNAIAMLERHPNAEHGLMDIAVWPATLDLQTWRVLAKAPYVPAEEEVHADQGDA